MRVNLRAIDQGLGPASRSSSISLRMSWATFLISIIDLRTRAVAALLPASALDTSSRTSFTSLTRFSYFWLIGLFLEGFGWIAGLARGAPIVAPLPGHSRVWGGKTQEPADNGLGISSARGRPAQGQHRAPLALGHRLDREALPALHHEHPRERRFGFQTLQRNELRQCAHGL